MKKLINTLSPCLILLFLVGWSSSEVRTFKTQCSRLPEKKILQIAENSLSKYLRYKSITVSSLKISKINNAEGVFVTLIKDNKTRGCMGILKPVGSSLSYYISKASIMAATTDTRFKPVVLKELPDIKYCVSIIGPLKPVSSISQLDPQTYGLLVKRGKKSAVLLPGEAKTAVWQLEECKRKAGISQKQEVQMYIFPTVVFGP